MEEIIKHPGGRPPAYKSAKEMQKKINKYFKECPDKKKYLTKTGETIEVPCPTICGLVLYLGFESRQSFYDYEEKPEFTYIVKKARTFIEKEYEQLLQSNYATGAIFALKNLGWTDKEQIIATNINNVQKIYIDKEEKEEVNKHIDEIINSK